MIILCAECEAIERFAFTCTLRVASIPGLSQMYCLELAQLLSFHLPLSLEISIQSSSTALLGSPKNTQWLTIVNLKHLS